MNSQKRFAPIWLVLLSLVLLRGLIYSLVIPVNQTPDELHHFGLIKAKQLAFRHATEEESKRMAARIELAGYYVLYPESPVQYTLADFPAASLPATPASLQIYYSVSAGLLNLLALAELRDEIYVIRGFSILCGVLIVWLACLVARELFPENFWMLLGVPAFVTFIPQFAATSGSINNDKLAEVFSALAFWLIVRIMKNGRSIGIFGLDVLSLAATIVLALLSKRTTVFLLPLFFITLWVSWWRFSLGIRMHLMFAGVFLGIGFLWYWLPSQSHFFSVIVYRFFTEQVIWVPPYRLKEFLLNPDLYSFAALKYYAKFFVVLYWSFWGIFGYMSMHVHHFWYLGLAGLQLFALGGLARRMWQVKRQQLMLERRQVKTYYLFAVSIVLMLLILFFRSVVFRGGAAGFTLTQGRYLFVGLVPIAVFTVGGVALLIPRQYARFAAIAGIVGFIVFDLVCLSNYLVLNFYRISLLTGVIVGERENQTDINREIGLWTRETTIAQTFVASQDDLARLDFWVDSFHPWDNPALECRLFEIQTEQNPLGLSYQFIQAHRTEVRAKRLNGWLISGHMFNSWTFPPLADSQNKRYLLTIQTPELKKSGSSILLASEVDRYLYFGNLFVNGEPQGGDLAFRALYAQPRGQLLRQAFAKIALQKPAPFSRPGVYYLIGLCYGVLLASLIYGVGKAIKK